VLRNLTIAAAGMFLASAGAQAQSTATPGAAASVATFSNTACYALASGAATIPAADPKGLDRAIKTVESFGLDFGAPNDITAHGPAVTAMVSRATLGSKTFADGQIIFSDGGAAGCRILLLADPKPGLTEAVAAELTAGGTWRAIPAMTATRGAIERRAFIRRDKANTPYLLNLMTVLDPPGKLRLFTTVARIPPNVTTPPAIDAQPKAACFSSASRSSSARLFFSEAVLSWPQAASMSRPRGVRTGAE